MKELAEPVKLAASSKQANESDDSEESCSALQAMLDKDNDNHKTTEKIVVEGY